MPRPIVAERQEKIRELLKSTPNLRLCNIQHALGLQGVQVENAMITMPDVAEEDGRYTIVDWSKYEA